MPGSFDQGSEPKRVAIYTRFSSKLQYSTEFQIRECREAAEKRGWIVLDEYIRSDKAKTGRTLHGRGGLAELMKIAQQEDCPFDGIVFYDTSRLCRELVDSLDLIRILKYSGVFAFFNLHSLDSRDPNFRPLFIQYASKDEDSSTDTGERVHSGQRDRVLKGYAASGRAYGYRNVRILSTDGAKWRYGRAASDGVRREIIPEQKEVVNRIFSMYVSGLGTSCIALKLNEVGVPSPGKFLGWPNKLWTSTTIVGILKNTAYIGIYTWNKNKQIYNPITGRKEYQPHPEEEWEQVEVPEWRMISDELWNAARAEHESRKGKAGRKKGGLNRSESSRKYLFPSLLRCEVCGRGFHVYRCGKGNPRYICSRYRYGCCPNSLSVTQPIADRQLLDALSGQLCDPALSARLSDDYCKLIGSRWDEYTAAVAQSTTDAEELRHERLELKSQAHNIMDTIQDCGKTDLLIERLKRIQEQLDTTESALELVAEKASPPPSAEEVQRLITAKLAELREALTAEPEVVKNRLAKHIDALVLKRVEVPEGLRYEAMGEIRVFAEGDPDDVLLACSFQRTCKQYTPLSFPLKASLIVKAGELEKRTQSAATRKKIGDAKRKWWAERKGATAVAA